MTFLSDHTQAESVARTRRAFDALRVHAIFGTGRWEHLSLGEAARIQHTVRPELRPVFILDRCSVDERILDVDIIDIRVHVALAAAAGSRAACEFGGLDDDLHSVGLGLYPGEGVRPAPVPTGDGAVSVREQDELKTCLHEAQLGAPR